MPKTTINPLAQLAPADIQGEASRLAEAQAIAQMLLQDSMTPTETMTNLGGGVQVANWGEMLGKAVQGMGARKKMAEAREGQSALSGKYQEGLAAEVGKFRELSQRDKAAAITMALMSPYKELRSYGEEMEKGMVTPRDQLKESHNYDPVSAANFSATGQGAIRGKKSIQFADNMAYQTQDGRILGSMPTSTYGEMGTNQGIPGQPRLENNRWTSNTGGNVTPAGNQGRMEMEGFQKKLQEGGKMFQDKIGTLRVLSQLESDVRRAPADKMGSLATIRNAWSKFAELISGSPEESTRILEQIQAGSGQLMLDKIRLVAPVTKEDIVVIQNIVGSERMSKDSLMRVLEIMGQRTMDEMGQHEDFAEAYMAESQNPDLIKKAYLPDFTASPVTGPVMPQGAAAPTLKTNEQLEAEIAAARARRKGR